MSADGYMTKNSEPGIMLPMAMAPQPADEGASKWT